MEWDVFISHSWRDKPAVRELAFALQQGGASVWYDEFTLAVGDSLRRSIDYGLANSRYGIVVLSPSFFAGEWTLKELDALVAREDGRQKVILPIWMGLSADDIRRFSPLLADKVAIRWNSDLGSVVASILHVVGVPAFNDQAQRRIEQRVRRLIEELEDQTIVPAERVAATIALRRMGIAAAPATQMLATHLNDPIQDVAVGAAWVLVAIGPSAYEAVPALANTVATGAPEVATVAAIALQKMGELAAEAIPSLIIALNRGGPVDYHAADALAAIGLMSVPALVEVVAHESVPYVVYKALEAIGPGAGLAVPALRQALHRPDQRNNYAHIINALSAMGPVAHEALPELLKMLDTKVRYFDPSGPAARAIVAVGMDCQAAGEVLSRALYKSNEDSAIEAITTALSRLGSIGVRYLAASLRPRENVVAQQKVVYYSAITLGRMGSVAEESVPVLMELIERHDNHIRLVAIEALSAMGPAAGLAIPLLIRHASKEDTHAITALGKIEPPNVTGIPTLLRLLQNPQCIWPVHATALKALADYGPVARGTMSYIAPFLQNDDERVREAAQLAAAAVPE